ncbi:hypothetical protein ACFL6S_34120 [Candidatus Poribacteria bacterium]
MNYRIETGISNVKNCLPEMVERGIIAGTYNDFLLALGYAA